MRNYVTCLFSNVRSVRNKLADIECLWNTEPIDIFVIIESWLSEKDSDSLFAKLNCNIVRRDRENRGGGILLLLRQNIVVTQILQDELLEILTIDINFGKKLLRLITVYIPDPKPKIVKCYFKKLKLLLQFPGNCVLLGDFNINYITDLIQTENISKSLSLLKIFISKNQPLYQFVTKATRKDHIIDLVFGNVQNLVFDLQVRDPISNSDHNSIFFKCPLINPKPRYTLIKCFPKSDYNNISKFLNNNLNSVLISENPNYSWLNFFNLLRFIIDTFVPQCKFNPETNKYINPKLKTLLRKKFKLWHKYKKSNSISLLYRYKDVKQNIKNILNKIEKIKQTNCFHVKIKNFLHIFEK